MYTLLIVDDEPKILEGLKETIDWKSLGFDRIDSAQTYIEAFDKAVELRPDIALFDVCIGDKRGYDIIDKLNAVGLTTKYVMISGYDEFEYVRKAMLCGAKDYLMKPVDREQLKRVIEKIIVEDLGGKLSNTSKIKEDFDVVLNIPYDNVSKLTNKVMLMVKTDFMNTISLTSVADRFKMNRTYIGQIFLRDTKIKFSEYLMAFRLIKAREFIIESDDKIINIARNVGYSNTQYFYTHFSMFYGESPSDIRNRHRKPTIK